MKKTICIDFDGVIAQYKEWKGANHFGAPVSGVQNALKVLKKEGYRIIIFTTRQVSDSLKAYLKENDITYDYINENPDQPKDSNQGKPIADIYLDDRGMCFRGDWKWTLEEIARFKPWTRDNAEEKKEMESIFDNYRKLSKDFNKTCNSL